MSNRKSGTCCGGYRQRMTTGRITWTSKSNVSCCMYETCCYHELNDCITILSTFLNSCVKPLTPPTLLEAHSIIGSIHESLYQTDPAKQSYIKALWIISANSTSDIFSIEVLATTLHCLGRMYGALGNHTEAIQLLQKGQKHFSLINVHKDHVIMMEVQQLLFKFNEQKEIDITSAERRSHYKFLSSSLSVSTLTLIVEDESE